MNIFIYDKSFEGLLSAVFYAYDTKVFPQKIENQESRQDKLFSEPYTIYTNEDYAQRVWSGLVKKQSKAIAEKVFRVFLSEKEGVEMIIFKYIQLCFGMPRGFDTDYANPTVLNFNNVYKSVSVEAHRAIMFIRFQKTADGVYFSPFEPQYNVLPLTLDHLKDRFADQRWVVYDTKRNYGFYYDLDEVQQITLSESAMNRLSGKLSSDVLDENELNFQELWKDYYQSTNIPERKNPKVHQAFMPKRFWKYLPEKDFSLKSSVGSSQ